MPPVGVRFLTIATSIFYGVTSLVKGRSGGNRHSEGSGGLTQAANPLLYGARFQTELVMLEGYTSTIEMLSRLFLGVTPICV
jgi:hypothetical protein